MLRRVRSVVSRVRGEPLAELRAEMHAELVHIRTVVLNINHVVTQTHEVVERLNHDVRAGAEPTLPLYLGYVERLRLDADVAVGATQVIERQLAVLAEQVAALERARDSG